MKVEIIDVDLGCDLKKIITDDLVKLTDEQTAEINTIVETERLTQDFAAKKKAAKTATEKALSDKMDAMYQKMRDEGFIWVKETVAYMAPEVATGSAFVLRMKKYLRNKGGEHYIERVLDKYVLKSYDRTDEEPVIEQDE